MGEYDAEDAAGVVMSDESGGLIAALAHQDD